jgi:microcin C transport system substrate-binding protein
MTKYILFVLLSFCIHVQAHAATHALTLFGTPKYPAHFSHFEYVNPDAPKGGSAKLNHPVTFDSLNPYILKGVAAPAINILVYETLMTPSLDEPQTYYPLLAKAVELAEDKRSITYTLDSRAYFADGTPVTVDDVLFSFNVLKEKGHPIYKLRYSDVERAEALDTHRIRFHFSAKSNNRDLPFITASLPVFSKAFFADRAFDKASLEKPLGSGAYSVASLDVGRSITFKRNPDYWAHKVKLPSRRGYFNMDTVRYDVYRDETVALEAFKAHHYDVREEYVARNWALSYNFAAVKGGKVILDNTPHQIPRGLQGFIFNMRKAKFKDRRVREAISLTFDFEWMNQTLFYDAYQRNNSLFQNTPFAARELPSEQEISLLAPYKESLPPALFTTIYNPPVSDGSGYVRDQLIRADKLLVEAGWVIKDGVRVHETSGEVLTIEMLSRQKSLDKVVQAMQRNLKTLGIAITNRIVDESQFQKRWERFDFDMTTIWWNMGLIYPGNEQVAFWHCSQAEVEGSQNMAGYCHPLVDKLLENITAAEDYDTLLTNARALDRVIMQEHVIIPHFSISHFRMAYWDKFGIPKVRPPYDRAFETWWVK